MHTCQQDGVMDFCFEEAQSDHWLIPDTLPGRFSLKPE
jgi:hypothetical protein